MTSLSRWFWVVSLCIGLVCSSHAQADDSKKLQELENRIKQMQETYFHNSQDAASAIARSQAMQQQASELTGRVEANQHLIEQQRAEMQRLFRDLDQRLRSMEDRLQIFSTQLSKALGKVAPQVAEEGEMYQKGLNAVQEGRYLEAVSLFQAFLKKYPKSQFAGDAQFWIGDCYMSMRDYQKAIKEYQIVIEKFPRNDHARKALLNQGIAFAELNMPDEAKAFFEKLIKTAPGTPEAARAQERITRLNERQAAGTPPQAPNLGSYPTQTIQQQRNSGAPLDTGAPRPDALSY